MVKAFKKNWKIYTMEAVCLGLFMVSASLFGTLLESPMSGIHQSLPDPFIRTCLMGVAMGITATLIIYSPMGKLSGAHMNPALTVAFMSLGKIDWRDTIYYSLFQCLGGLVAVYFMALLLGNGFIDQPVNYVATLPFKGEKAAFQVEIIIAFLMMTMVLVTSNHSGLSRYTGVIAGIFVMSFVIISGPISGFSMNPARTIASAIPSHMFDSFWIYMAAPFIGMMTATGTYGFFKGRVICCKMHHSPGYTCIFHCGYCKHQNESI